MSHDCRCACHGHRTEHVHEHCHEHEHEHHNNHAERCDRCRCEHGGERPGGGDGGTGEPGGPGGQTGNPNRPGKVGGSSRGRTDDPTPLNKGDLTTEHPPDSWAGPRKDLYLPFLFMRANPGDLGKRRVVGPFWESPDVLILAGVEPSLAPDVPPPHLLGQTALAGLPNTVYAHVWNFGHAQAPEVVVEFHWCDPTLGIGPGSAHLIGQKTTSLGARGSGAAHALVKCPEAWTPTFLNGGHECLVVRFWDHTSDALGTPPWDSALNRHVAQRNIHVVRTGAPMPLLAGGDVQPLIALPVANTPLLLRVGPLYGEPAQVTVTRTPPHTMPWLQLHTGVRGQFPQQAVPTGTVLLSKPGPIGGGAPMGGLGQEQHIVGDDQQVAFTTTDAAPGPGEAHVYRVSASQGGEVFGGYTVVLIGS
jgi:hypothetical protein